jgi:hypothetical protein
MPTFQFVIEFYRPFLAHVSYCKTNLYRAGSGFFNGRIRSKIIRIRNSPWHRPPTMLLILKEHLFLRTTGWLTEFLVHLSPYLVFCELIIAW